MFPIFNRNFAFFGAPVMGFGFGAPSIIVEPVPRPMHCGNPFMSFMGGFMGGMGMAAAFGWGNSYASYSFSPSVFSGYQTYPSYPVSSPYGFNFTGGFDFTDVALNNVFSNLMSPFSAQSNMSAPATWSSTPFGSLAQSARPQYQTPANTPARAQSQTSAPTGNYRPQNNTAAPANNNAAPVNNVPVAQSQQTNPTTTTAPANQTAAQEAPVAHTVTPIQTASIRTQSLVPFKQRYDQLVANLNATVDTQKLDGQVLNYTLKSQMTDSFNTIESLDSKGSEPDDSEKALLEERLNKLAQTVATCQKNYPIDNTPPKTEAQLKAEEDHFNSTCKGGDCGDYSDRLYFNMEKGEWEKSTKKGYPKQPIAPESTLVEVPEMYRTDKSGVKCYLNPEALKHFMEMSDDAGNTVGMELTITSAYRNYKDQEREFENDKERLHKSKAEGNNPLPKAAPPGYSEHHTGNTFDIANISVYNAGNRDEWLKKHAREYGFELSYPPNNKLGVLQEGWHYRYNPELFEKYGNKTPRVPDEIVKVD